MALVTKIREKSGWAIGIIAVSMILFIIGGDVIASRGMFSKNQEVGEIGGETVLIQDFQKRLDELRTVTEMQSGRSLQSQELDQLKNKLWEDYVFENVFSKEHEALGLVVSDKEFQDMTTGENIHSAVIQAFTNPQTKTFDKNTVLEQQKRMKTAPKQEQKAWASFEKELSKMRINEKYQNLFRSSSYVTSFQAEKEYQAQNTKVDFKYLAIPYSLIPETEIKIEDSEIENYYSEHKGIFKGYDSREINYVLFSNIPSAADSAAMLNTIKKIAGEFAVAENAELYARNNSDIPHPTLWNLSQMDEQLRSNLPKFIEKSVYGPFKTDNNYTLYKNLGTQTDSLYTMRASHILVQILDKSESGKAEARKKATEILDKIKKGANFEMMASQFGTDGTAQRGGDLGYFQNNNRMVKPFQSALFGFSGKGLMPNLVETDFGFHIVKVTEAKSNLKYKVLAITKTLLAGDQTNNSSDQKADQFANEFKTKVKLEEAAKKEKLPFLKAMLSPQSKNVNDIPNAQEIIRWAFDSDTDLEETSKVFRTEKGNVLAVVTQKNEQLKPTYKQFSNEIKQALTKEKKLSLLQKKVAGLASKSFEEIVKSVGGATKEVKDVTPFGASFEGNSDASGTGKLLGLKEGQKSKPFKGDFNVFIVELLKSIPAPSVADYSTYRTQTEEGMKQYAPMIANQVILDNAKIIDKRFMYF